MRKMLAAVALCALAFITTGATEPPSYLGGCSEACVERVKAKVQKVRKAREWRYWSRQPIPTCTWLGESGPPRAGHGRGLQQFAFWRYSVPNSAGSGAYGKFQLMPSTKAAFDKYGDWSRLDQEIAAHRLYRAQGTSPWSAC
jgi:hypothetical protein